MLLHVFLIRRYRHVDIVFIRHTSTAEEVDEETFFYSRETGGTVVSTALEKMLEIARARYPTDRWNIYAAQASDGDNYGADSGRCVTLLGGEVLPLCQYFAYVEVGDGMGGSLTGLSRDSDLWQAYSKVAPGHPHIASMPDPIVPRRRRGRPPEVPARDGRLLVLGIARDQSALSPQSVAKIAGNEKGGVRKHGSPLRHSRSKFHVVSCTWPARDGGGCPHYGCSASAATV